MQIINRGDYYNTKFYDPEDGRFVSQDMRGADGAGDLVKAYTHGESTIGG